MITKQEIRQLDSKKIDQEILSAEHELMKTLFSIRGGHSKENHPIKNYKKYIAQLKTIKKELELKSVPTAEVVEKPILEVPKKTKKVTSVKAPKKTVLSKKK